MKNVLLLALLWGASAALHAQSRNCDRLVYLANDTVVCQEYNTRKARLYKETYYLKGQVLFCRRWHYKRNGEYYYYHSATKSSFAARSGPARWYYPGGQLKTKVNFVDDKKVGECLSFYPNGSPKRICHHNVVGQEDGVISTFHPNGQLSTRSYWLNDRLLDVLDNKDEQGNDIPVGTFKDGTGTWNHEGKIVKFKNGKQLKRLPKKAG